MSAVVFFFFCLVTFFSAEEQQIGMKCCMVVCPCEVWHVRCRSVCSSKMPMDTTTAVPRYLEWDVKPYYTIPYVIINAKVVNKKLSYPKRNALCVIKNT